MSSSLQPTNQPTDRPTDRPTDQPTDRPTELNRFADGSLKDLLTQLAQEEENLTTARGLEDGSTVEGGDTNGVGEACQTFEM